MQEVVERCSIVNEFEAMIAGLSLESRQKYTQSYVWRWLPQLKTKLQYEGTGVSFHSRN